MKRRPVRPRWATNRLRPNFNIVLLRKPTYGTVTKRIPTKSGCPFARRLPLLHERHELRMRLTQLRSVPGRGRVRSTIRAVPTSTAHSCAGPQCGLSSKLLDRSVLAELHPCRQFGPFVVGDFIFALTEIEDATVPLIVRQPIRRQPSKCSRGSGQCFTRIGNRGHGVPPMGSISAIPQTPVYHDSNMRQTFALPHLDAVAGGGDADVGEA